MVSLRPDLRRVRAEWHQTLDNVRVATGLHKGTILKIERGESVLESSIAIYAKHFGWELDDVINQPVIPPLKPKTLLGHIIKKQGPVETAANGLQWRICELEDPLVPSTAPKGKVIPKRRIRAKLYDLSQFEGTDLWRLKTTYLPRHADVCTRIGRQGMHPNIAHNLFSFQDPKDTRMWWMLDEWIEGAVTLEERLKQGPMRSEELKRCMTGVAAGLQALHKVGIVRRELTPKFVLLNESQVVLTEFELAKLLDGSPSVRPDEGGKWEYAIYVAPEANYDRKDMDRDEIEEGATSWDLYSWAIMLAHAASGRCPRRIEDAQEFFSNSSLPDPLLRFALLCLRPQLDRSSKNKNRRPTEFPPKLDLMFSGR